MKTALYSVTLIVFSVGTVCWTTNQEELRSIDQIRSEELVAPGGDEKERQLEQVIMRGGAPSEASPEVLSLQVINEV